MSAILPSFETVQSLPFFDTSRVRNLLAAEGPAASRVAAPWRPFLVGPTHLPQCDIFPAPRLAQEN